MKSLVTMLVLAASLYSPLSFAATNVTDANFKQTIEVAAKAKQKMVITFHATWCGACKQMLPLLDVAEKKYTSVKFFRIDIDSNPKLAGQVPFVPLTLLLQGTTSKGMLQGAAPDQKSLNKSLEKAFGVK